VLLSITAIKNIKGEITGSLIAKDISEKEAEID
jgi:hypothetical protein